MKHEQAAQLAEWIGDNTRGYAQRNGSVIYIEGKIDAFELLLYAQSLLAGRTTEQIHEDNRISYTGRADLYRRNAVVEGSDW